MGDGLRAPRNAPTDCYAVRDSFDPGLDLACGRCGLPVKAPALAAPIFSWTGWHVGVNVGATHSDVDVDWDAHINNSPSANPQINSFAATTFDRWGFTGGGQLGYDRQVGALVLGAEADIQYTGLKDSRSVTYIGVLTGSPNTITQSFESNWLATLRGRVGVTTQGVLLYATGGLAVGQVKYGDSRFVEFNGQLFAASSDETRVGWTVGGGAEMMLSSRWSVKAEYLHVDLGKTSYTSAGSSTPTNTIDHFHRFTEDLVRLGLNYRFSGG
jgi:outer membrane immunogenic protein